MSFPYITSAAGPEDFSWEVELGEEQELRPIDEKSAAVYYDGGHIAFSIVAIPAHDATGASVPTSLAVSEENRITLTVHHRAGNPKASGAPFDYPVVGGEGWEGGFSSVRVILPQGDFDVRGEEEERRAEAAARHFHIPCASNGRGGLPQIRPSRCLVREAKGSAISLLALVDLRWRDWQGPVARADGFLVDRQAHARQAVRVALSGEVSCDGLRYYKRIRIKPPAARPLTVAIAPC